MRVRYAAISLGKASARYELTLSPNLQPVTLSSGEELKKN
jgi:hypothetical protein